MVGDCALPAIEWAWLLLQLTMRSLRRHQSTPEEMLRELRGTCLLAAKFPMLRYLLR